MSLTTDAAARLAVDRWPDLPQAVKYGVAERVGDRLFTGLGSAGAAFFCFPLNARSAAWQTCAPFPGIPPSGAACAASRGRIYIFGGSGAAPGRKTPTVLDAIHCFDPATNAWHQLATLPPCGLLGAKARPLSDGRILVLGGYSKPVFDELQEALAQAPIEQRPMLLRHFMSQPPAFYGWNDNMLLFDPTDLSWTVLEQNPLGATCESSLHTVGADRFALCSGEIKPGLRQPDCVEIAIGDAEVTAPALPPIPPVPGETASEGLAGACGGMIRGQLHLVGGTNFAGARARASAGLWFAHDGLKKRWLDHILALTPDGWVLAGHLPHGIAYGAVFAVDPGLLIAGGERPDGQASNECLFVYPAVRKQT